MTILIDGIPDIIPKSSTQMVERLIGQLTTRARRLREHGLPLIGLRLCTLDRARGHRQDGVISVLSLGGRSSDRCFHELNQFRGRSRNPSGEFIEDRLVALMPDPDQYRHRRQTQCSGDLEIIEPMQVSAGTAPAQQGDRISAVCMGPLPRLAQDCAQGLRCPRALEGRHPIDEPA